LESQKAMVDYVVQKAGALAFQAKQAEALIESLREERELTSRVKTAFARLREDGEAKPQEPNVDHARDNVQDQDQDQDHDHDHDQPQQ